MKIAKRIIKIFSCILIFCLIFCAISVVAIDYVDNDKRDKIIGNTKAENGLFYFIDENTSTDTRLQMRAYCNTLPSNIKNDLKEKDWVFVFSEKIPEELLSKATDEAKGNLGTLQGLTVSTLKIIFIRVGPDALGTEETFIHEVGHAIGCDMNYVYAKKEFIDIYKKDAASYGCSEYAKSDISEFFANGFKDYILRPDYLKNENARMYKFYKENITGEFPGSSLKSKITNSPIAVIRLLISKIV